MKEKLLKTNISGGEQVVDEGDGIGN